MRNLLALLAGYALWTALWLGGDVAARVLWPDAYPADFPETPMSATTPLVATLALSVVCSLAGGRLTGTVAKRRGPVWILALLLLATGIGVQASAWSALPLWYHLPFLALLVPVTLLGGRSTAAGAQAS